MLWTAFKGSETWLITGSYNLQIFLTIKTDN